MRAVDFNQERVGEEAAIVGEVRESVKGVFYDKIGYWLKLADSSGEAWVFSETDFNRKTRVKAEGLIEKNYDQVSLISGKIAEYDGEEIPDKPSAGEEKDKKKEKKGGGNLKLLLLLIIVITIAVALAVKLRPELLEQVKTMLPKTNIRIPKLKVKI